MLSSSPPPPFLIFPSLFYFSSFSFFSLFFCKSKSCTALSIIRSTLRDGASAGPGSSSWAFWDNLWFYNFANKRPQSSRRSNISPLPSSSQPNQKRSTTIHPPAAEYMHTHKFILRTRHPLASPAAKYGVENAEIRWHGHCNCHRFSLQSLQTLV